MKIATVALLAGTAMGLASLTVWALTPAASYRAEGESVETPVPAPQERDRALEATDRRAPAESWKFSSGSTLRVEGRLGHSTLPSGRDSESYVFVDVRAEAAGVATTPAPLNLAIVVDRSGSMRGKRLDNAIAAAKGTLRRLRDGDVVSVVSFDSRVTEVVPPTPVDESSRERLVARMDSIVPGGETCISCGLESAMSLLRGRGDRVHRVLLLSDGDATEGVRDVPGLRALAGRMRDMGATVTTVGVDVEYNERIMSAIALESNGRHHFVANAADLPRVFDTELQSLVRTVAKDAELRVTLAPGVELLQVFDRTFRREGNDLVVPLGTFTAAEDKTLLVRVRVPRGIEGERAVASVRLGFDDLVSRGRGSCEGELGTLLTSDPGRVSSLDSVVAGRLGRSTTADSLNSANGLWNRGQLADARRELERARGELVAQRSAATAAAPGELKAQVAEDFDKQLAALDDAAQGFAPATPGAPAPAATAAPAQVRSNASRAVDLAF
ncbi:MAG: VWA domain-containing protein [Polyangiaceae bacterium]|nr:VWA domain-containing protein [Polyangiaceae bacterium]